MIEILLEMSSLLSVARCIREDTSTKIYLQPVNSSSNLRLSENVTDQQEISGFKN
jgi:hypothetical protein